MVGMRDRMASADSFAITRAMLEGALHKANDAVRADHTQEWDYAMQAYGDSCALLGRCMERTNQRDELGAIHWQIMEGIRNSYIRRIYDIRELHNPRTPPSRSLSRSRTPKLGVDSQRSSTWVRTPPRTPKPVRTPPRTPRLAAPTMPIQMQERSISVWSED